MSNARDFASRVPVDGALSNRNLIINGAMQVAQRGTSSSSAGYQTVDRFRFTSSDMDQLAFTQSQDTTGPSGFTNSYKLTVTTPETTTEAEEQLFMFQAIEAQNLQQLGYGTAEAKQLTLSFWVKSSVTGAYCVAFYQNDGNRLITSTYSINSANTWEYKTITIDGDTSGTINNDNGAGLELYFFLSVGPDRKTTDSTSWGTWAGAKFGYGQVADVAATSGATWQITGIQLEVGDTATPFEHEPISVTRSKCLRYYEKSYNDGTAAASTTNVGLYWQNEVSNRYSDILAHVPFKVEKRTDPTMTFYPHAGTITANNAFLERGTAAFAAAVTVWSRGSKGVNVYSGSGGQYTQCQYMFHWIADAEL